MKIIAIVNYNKATTVFTRAIGRLSPLDTLADLYKQIQEQKTKLGAEQILEIRLDIEE